MPSFAVTEILSESAELKVLRARRDDGELVVLKQLAAGVRLSAQQRLRHEFDLLRRLDVPGVVKVFSLEVLEDGQTMVMEDIGGVSLDRGLAPNQKLTVDQFLPLAVGIADSLAGLHRRHIVHKAVNPGHLILNFNTGAFRLVGFGNAEEMEADLAAESRSFSFEGDSSYAAPEQTGRMNRRVDHRSDFYSLGATFYRLLTGQAPFKAEDAIGLVHQHIAVVPPSPDQLVASIPAPLSGIVMKLLAKNAEERYLTADGLKTDLERCALEWREHGHIGAFTLGAGDLSDRLLIPEKLYGREEELETLRQAFDRVAKGGRPELVLIAGYSGVGKSALANGMHRNLASLNGLFASGKFDQYQQGVPYATLAHAFKGLIQGLLGKSEVEIVGWRHALTEALGGNGRLITSLVPELELVIGPQSQVPELDASQAKARFQLVFNRFVSVFARAEHPLVLFLDDLQWLDAATLDLIQNLLTQQDVGHLLLIGAYRSNEVGPDHPLRRKIEAVRATGLPVWEVALAPLPLERLSQLVADSLRCSTAHAESLVRLIHEKTGGNPFFVIQFLTALAQEGLLAFDHASAVWSWNLDSICAKGYSDNVADLMAGKLVGLPEPTRRALHWLACLGNVVPAQTLSLIAEISEAEIHAALEEAVAQKIVIRSAHSYQFVHDRVQEAAYGLIPPEARATAHLRIGRLLLANTPEEGLPEAVFQIVNQLNHAQSQITSASERVELARLNLLAGRRAKAATAYASALRYFVAGKAMLVDDTLGELRDLAFAFELLQAECEFLTGELATAEHRLAALWPQAKDISDLAAITRLRLPIYMTLDRSDKAVAAGLEYLEKVGVTWSPHPAEMDVKQEFEDMWRRIGNRPIETLIDLPAMTDPGLRGTVGVLAELLPVAVFTDGNLHRLIVARIANLSLAHGNDDGACFAYVWLGMLLGPLFGDYEAGFRFGQLSVNLVEKRGLLGFKARVYLGFAHVVPWTRHVRSGVPLVRTAIDTARQTGDLSFANISGGALITHLLASGESLENVQREAEALLERAQKARFGLVVDVLKGQLGLIRTLRGQTLQFGCFTDMGFDESQFEEHINGNPRLAYAAWRYWIRKLQSRYQAGDYESAVAAAAMVERFHSLSYDAYFEIAEYHFYAALALTAYLDQAPADLRGPSLERLGNHQRQLDVWARYCPENFENRRALIAAEIARREDRVPDAEQLYEQAIESARAQGLVHIEALANELAGRFFFGRGLKRIGLVQLREARVGYGRWGAEGKIRQLDRLYPQLENQEPQLAGSGNELAPGQLDLETIVKASQALSSEIELPKLTKTLMTVALQNAGADRGLLILADGDSFGVEVEAKAVAAGIEIRMVRATGEQTIYPEALINYVVRTMQNVIIDDTSRPDSAFDDAYLRTRQACSIFALPLLRQGKLAGVLYLENTQTPYAFTPARVSVLGVLGGQAAISLQSARLYGELRESEARYSRIVNTASEGIWAIDANGVTTFINSKMAEMLGYQPQEIIGRPGIEFMFEDEVQDHENRMEHRRQGVDERYERRFRHKDGHAVWVSASAAPIFDDKHCYQGSFAMLTDVTESRAAAEELRRYKDHLEEEVQQRTVDLVQARNAADAANLAKSVFLSNMSHELRTPLNAILGFSDIVRRAADLPDGLRANMDIIKRSGEHLLALINDVLEMAKIEAGRIHLVIAPFDLGGMVRDVKEMMQVRAEEKGLLLQVDQDSRFPRFIEGDEARLRQVLINLLGNAVKFTDRGSVTLRLKTRANRISHLVIEVEDTGAGIASKDQQRIFEPFVQLGDQGGSKGTGLGLTICRQFVEMMGGHIELASEVGKGTLFRVDLPLREVQEADVAPFKEKECGDVVGLVPGQPRYRILIVEDQRDNQMLLLRIMETLGLDVRVAENGEEGVRLFGEWRPDLIWMDRRMPGIDGLEATRRIRGLSGGKEVKIVAITASAFREQQDEMREGGVDDFISKPYRIEEIYDSLARQLGLRYLRREASDTPLKAALTAEALGALPHNLVRDLKFSLETLDQERIDACIQAVGLYDKALQQTLQHLTDGYDYQAILDAMPTE